MLTRGSVLRVPTLHIREESNVQLGAGFLVIRGVAQLGSAYGWGP